MAAKNPIKLLSLLLLPLVIVLALSSFQQAKWLAQERDSDANDLLNNLPAFDLYATSQAVRLQDTAREMEKSLEFMVWPVERGAIQKNLLTVYKDQINLNMLNGVLWQKIANLESIIDGDQQELDYSVRQALQHMKWRNKSYAALVYLCISQDRKLNVRTQNECLKLFAKYGNGRAVHGVSNSLGINHNDLEAILAGSRLLP